MVNLVEISASEEPVDLKRIKDRTMRYERYGDRVDKNETLYCCDCDGFGGGDPPCDCNK